MEETAGMDEAQSIWVDRARLVSTRPGSVVLLAFEAHFHQPHHE